MRYIRTKDGKIWSFSKPYGNFVYEGGDKKNGKWWFEIGEPVKKADTIEELCDCYVVYEKSGGFVGEHHTYNDLELAKYGANEHVSIVYGAIWTDKGLIYVAKMNEKEEFELL